MQKAKYHRGNRVWNAALFLIAVLLVAADQLSKLWVRSTLAIGQSIPETGFFRLTHIQNTGAAFGLFHGQSFSLTIVGLIGTAVLLLYIFLIPYRFPHLDSRLSKPALALVLGGTIGNLIDRLRYGYVTDFIDISIWPAFNIADSAITVGIIIFAYSLLSSVKTGEQ